MIGPAHWLRKQSEKYLDPVDRLPEVVLGLILVLGVTGTLRVSVSQTGFSVVNLLLAVIGVNVAWGIVDGVMYAIGSYFTRNRYATISKVLRKDRDNAKAKEALLDDLDNTIIHTLKPIEREHIISIVADAVPSIPDKRAFFKDFSDDLIGGIWIFFTVFVTLFPVIIPFIVFPSDPLLALNISNSIALIMMFIIGVEWGGYAGIKRLGPGIGFLIIGTIITLITLYLGG
jgi:hypothetical protein